MIILLGIDPGSIKTGYGLISCSNHTINYIDSGNINMNITNNISKKLYILFNTLNKIIKKFSPNISILEKIFTNKNYNSIIKLSYARGVIILAITKNKLTLYEYNTIKIKYIITGKKFAKKKEIQNAIKIKFKLSLLPKNDEADALAIALTYYYLNIYNKNDYI